jgi:hypothetical protein
VTTGAAIEVWQERGGFWRWRYRDDDGVDLLSNENHVSRDRAVHAASLAYPGVPVTEHADAMVAGLGLGRTLGRAGLGGLALAAAVALSVPITVRSAWRRLWRRLDSPP